MRPCGHTILMLQCGVSCVPASSLRRGPHEEDAESAAHGPPARALEPMDCAPSLGATPPPAPSPAKHLPPRLGRRPFLRGVGGLALAALAPAWSPLAVAEAGTPRPGALARVPWGERVAGPLAQSAAAETVYVFNVGSHDVTLIDAATRQVRETRPLGAQVRWLSNIQPHWDGQYVWTYDFPDNRLQAIPIDPQTIVVARTVADIGHRGPGTAWCC